VKKIFIALAIVFTLLIFTPPSFSHSGRTDANGGHYNRKTGEYHYHNGGSSSSGSSSESTIIKPTYTAPLPAISVYVNGKKVYCDQEPLLTGGRVLVPLRAIMEALGATVEWDSQTATIVARRQGFELTHSVGKWYAFANGNQIDLDVLSRIENGRTLVPVRVISESLGATVNWDDVNRTVNITYQ
jgi:hypothetical protein